MFRNCQLETNGLQSIRDNSKMVLQEDCYDTLHVQSHIAQIWSEQRSELLHRPAWSTRSKQAFSLQKLSAIVDYAYANTPFYRSLYGKAGYDLGGIRSLSDFRALPVVDKHMLRAAALEDLISDEYRPVMRNLYWSSTSGSSGHAMPILNNIDTATAITLSYLRMFSRACRGRLTPDRWIYNVHHIRGWTSSLLGQHPTFTLNDIRHLGEFIQHLEFLRPALLTTLPSYLPLLESYGERVRHSGLCAIITNSETSSAAERNYFSERLGIPVTDEYSSEEVGIIAIECCERSYHPQFDFVHVDFGEADAHGLCHAYCTDLTARTMPFIRYDHGDLLCVAGEDDSECACGVHGRVIKQIEGRKDDCLKTPHGNYVPTAIVTNTLDSYFNDPSSGVLSFRLIQHARAERFTFQFVGAASAAVTERIDKFSQELREILGLPIEIAIDNVAELPASKSYKRKKIVSECT